MDLQQQIAQENAEIQNAPVVQSTGFAGRCGWCGSVRIDLELVEVVHDVERYKGGCCRAS
jgi:hypothetical protein